MDEQQNSIRKENALTLNYSVREMTTENAKTRTTFPATAEEKTINTLRLFFFEYSKDGSGKFVESCTVKPDELTANNGNTLLQLPSTIQKDNAYVILAVANAPEEIYNLSDNQLKGKSEEAFTSEAQISITLDNKNLPIDSKNIAMSDRIVKEKGQRTLDINLERIPARIDITLRANGYMLQSASVWNAAMSSYIWGEKTDLKADHSKRFFTISQSFNFTSIQGLYALSNRVSKPEQKDEVTTCVVVGLRTAQDTNNDGIPDDFGKLQYYRINIVRDDMQYLKSNKVYHVNILNILSKGDENEEDAMNNPRLLLDVDTNYWNIDENGTIQSNGDDKLITGMSRIQFYPAGGTREISVITIGKGELRISEAALPAGITATLGSKKEDGNTTSYSLKITAQESDKEETGIITLEFNGMKATVKVIQTGKTTHFINVTPKDNIHFEANKDESSEDILIASSDEWEAKIYNGNYFSFDKTKSILSTEGSADDKINIYTTQENTGASANMSFVVFNLKKNPEVTATITLSQTGSGGISLDPGQKEVNFDASGLINKAKEFTVSTKEQQEWIITFEGNNDNHFVASPMSGGNDGKFTVSTSINTTTNKLHARLRVALKDMPNSFVVMDLYQAPQYITLSSNKPSTVVPTEGGKTEDIFVTSSGNWEATIETNGATKPATLSQSKGASGESFYVTFEANNTPGVYPTATVNVKIKGTNIGQTIVFTQGHVPPTEKLILMHQRGKGWDDCNIVAPNEGLFVTYYSEAIYEFYSNEMYFGPNSQYVQTAGKIDIQYNSSYLADPELDKKTTKDAAVRIYWDGYQDETYTNKFAYDWKNKSDKNVIVITMGDYYYENYGTLDLLQNLYSPKATQYKYDHFKNEEDHKKFTPQGAYESCNTPHGKKLWNYLLKDGPFTDGKMLNPEEIIYKNSWGGTHSTKGIEGWPDSFVPLIIRPDDSEGITYCQLGIDPTHNIVLMNGQLFNRYWASSGGSDFKLSDPAGLFLGNILAYIVNAAQYGKTFTDQFK
jgi:hypothetical protein